MYGIKTVLSNQTPDCPLQSMFALMQAFGIGVAEVRGARLCAYRAMPQFTRTHIRRGMRGVVSVLKRVWRRFG
jgi:hypothetical protein